MSKSRLPSPTSTDSFWRTEPHPLDSHRSTPELPTETDVVIIGAGYAGAALAYYIYKDNPSPPSVTILEARQACSGATGRNGGHIKPDLYFNIPKYIKKYGVKGAVEVADFEASHVSAIKELVEQEAIDCQFTLTRACDAVCDEGLARDTAEAYHLLKASGVAHLADVHYTPRDAAERVSGVKGALNCFTFTAAHVWPYKLVMHLLQNAVDRGANLQTHTPVLRIADAPRATDGRWRISTARGDVLARKVLLATNAYTSHVAPQFTDRIVPVRGICSRIVVPAGRTAPLLTQTYSVRQGPGLYDYLIPRNDGSIIVGGARPRFWHDRTQWYDVTDDGTLIEPAVTHFDGLMQRTFLNWEDSGAYTDKVWTGIMGYTTDSMPYVGEVPDKPGQFIVAGFTGHGMPRILLSAKAVAHMVRDGVPFEQTGVPSVFKATRARLASTQNEILEGHNPEPPKPRL